MFSYSLCVNHLIFIISKWLQFILFNKDINTIDPKISLLFTIQSKQFNSINYSTHPSSNAKSATRKKTKSLRCLSHNWRRISHQRYSTKIEQRNATIQSIKQRKKRVSKQWTQVSKSTWLLEFVQERFKSYKLSWCTHCCKGSLLFGIWWLIIFLYSSFF